MPDRYPQVMRLASETPWAILPSKLAAIQELLAIRASGERLSPAEIQARIGAREPQRQAPATGNVAVIPIYGTIIPKASLMSDISGGTSIQGLSDALAAAVADDSIGAILLDIDSPGGSTYLLPEFAAEIREARGSKPIVAIANTAAASAAYWIASQADELVVTPSGIVGSIGVYAAHEDISAKLAQDGVAVTLIKAGRYKAEANPFEPLSDEARAAIQDQVDQTYAMFVGDVAAGRGVTASAVENGFGEGRVVMAQDALAAGMVDRVDTFEATVQRLIGQAASTSGIRLAAAHQTAMTMTASGTTAWTLGDPPGTPPASQSHQTNPQAADSGLSFAQSILAVRDQVDRITTDARALCALDGGRGLTAAKRDALGLLEASASELAAVIAGHDAGGYSPDHLAFIEELKRSKT